MLARVTRAQESAAIWKFHIGVTQNSYIKRSVPQWERI